MTSLLFAQSPGSLLGTQLGSMLCSAKFSQFGSLLVICFWTLDVLRQLDFLPLLSWLVPSFFPLNPLLQIIKETSKHTSYPKLNLSYPDRVGEEFQIPELSCKLIILQRSISSPWAHLTIDFLLCTISLQNVIVLFLSHTVTCLSKQPEKIKIKVIKGTKKGTVKKQNWELYFKVVKNSSACVLLDWKPSVTVTRIQAWRKPNGDSILKTLALQLSSLYF